MNNKLKNAILRQIGVTAKEFKANASDYMNAQNGISGFIYYNETHAFALKYQQEINELLEETAEQMGEDVLFMVKNFGVFKGEMDREETKDLYKFLGGKKREEDYETYAVLNVLAWFAVEQLAFEMQD